MGAAGEGATLFIIIFYLLRILYLIKTLVEDAFLQHFKFFLLCSCVVQ